MGMNETPASERIHIGIFGRRNAGKSSIINAITGQNLAIVSEVKGTTTDPVYKSMELLPLGPVVLIDTPGLDDEGELGLERIKKSHQVLNKTDIAILVIDGTQAMNETEEDLIRLFQKKKIPYVIVVNKADLLSVPKIEELEEEELIRDHGILVSATNKQNIHELKEVLGSKIAEPLERKKIVADILKEGDLAVLVVPVDSAAPKGRLILPQQQTIRDLLDAGCMALVTREDKLTETLQQLNRSPAIVITDSQVFGQVAKKVPEDVRLTSFSILFARYKGNLPELVKGAATLEQLKEGAHILISEGCTHHRQCEDIGTVKLPNWLERYTGKKFELTFTSGTEFPMDLSPYDFIIHCGACMLNEREVKYRIACAGDAGIPITNYGICIAYMNGILKRTLQPFPDIASLLP